jgi:ABC-type multidrug transport system fused ATPase/permease subunit
LAPPGAPSGVLAMRARESGVGSGLPVGRAAPAVAFDRVWFAYREDEWVLSDVSFEVMPGETVAFVGHTGAGKSTIMNLVPRFYDVQRGAVRVHGVDVRNVTQDELRHTVGIVMQDVFLFATDIAANVSLDNEAIDRAAVERAGRVVGADAFVERLPQGYDTPVVERGLNLSTGQRQMVSFARTLAYDPRVLILDEATSSVDSETEEALQHAMRALAAGRTTIVVAHRLATVRDADRIYVMHRGRIVDQGRHDDLLQHDGMYRTLWRLQYEGVAGA